MRRFRQFLKIGLVVALVSAVALGVVVWMKRNQPTVALRLDIVSLKLNGALPGADWATVLDRLLPLRFASGYGLGGLAVELPARFQERSVLLEAEKTFERHCLSCHGVGGHGGVGADLRDPRLHVRRTNDEFYRAISEGVAGSGMPGFALGATKTLQLVGYVRSLRAAGEAGPETFLNVAGCELCQRLDVPYERIRMHAPGTDGWLTYSGSYDSKRFSPLDDIRLDNVAAIRPKWIYQLGGRGAVEAAPLVADGLMFLTDADNSVLALDAANGALKWKHERVTPAKLSLCCGTVNRGIALLGKRIFHNTLDGKLVALDAANGSVLWEVSVADPAGGYSMTAAPLAVDGMIVVGVAGGDFGVRGFLAAYSAGSGDQLWRFYTVPAPGDPGSETWPSGDAWKHGGGATWLTGSYDADLGLIYWGVGNPGPDFDGDVREGDNLYTNSVIAINAKTGKLAWYYQFTPHDTNDWDSNQIPVLIDAQLGGVLRRLMLWGNRNCFFYVLDRESGEFLHASEYCKQTWNTGFTDSGRPIRAERSRPTAEGQVIYPASFGGANWYSPAFLPSAGLFYIPYRIHHQQLFKKAQDFRQGAKYEGGYLEELSGSPGSGAIRAIDWRSGEVRWTHEHARFSRSGLLVTGGGLLFSGGDDGNLIGLDAKNGDVVWKYRLGAPLQMAPVTYLHDGHQEIAVIAGNAVVVFSLSRQ